MICGIVMVLGVAKASYPILIYNSNLEKADMFLSQEELVERLAGMVRRGRLMAGRKRAR